MDKNKINIADITPGFIYLTLGTAQQVLWLYRNSPCNFSVLYEPTTLEFKRETERRGYIGEEEEQRVFIVYPKDIKGTGLIKSPKKETKKDNIFSLPSLGEDEKNIYLLPNDQFFTLDPSLLVFIICSDIDGSISKDSKSKSKKLVGNQYKLLDLEHLDYSGTKWESIPREYVMFPLGYVQREKDLKGIDNRFHIEDEVNNKEFELVRALGTKEGFKIWSSLPREEVYRLFMIEEMDKPFILSLARAWCIQVYLEPFVKRLKEDITLTDASALLGMFAYWVYCCSKYWAEPYREGLKLYLPKKGEITPTFSFWVSPRGKMMWYKIVTNQLL